MWHYRDFTFSKGFVGRFEVFGAYENAASDWSKVVTYCRTEAAGEWITNAMHRIALKTFVGPDFKYEFMATAKKCKRPGINFGYNELSFLLNMEHTAVIFALNGIGVPPEAGPELKAEKISVGPCSFFDGNKRYAKVRFNGMSLRFYFDDKGWLPIETEKATTVSVGGLNADAIYKLLTDNADVLYKKAITRPLNISNVDDYAHHNLTILKYGGDGNFYTATNAEIAEPNSKLAYVFDYGYGRMFASIEDVIYKVAGVITGYSIYARSGQELQQGTWSLVYKNNGKIYNGYMRMSDCSVLDSRDQFVREKIGRSMKAKL